MNFRLIRIPALFILFLSQTGCGILLGNVKPVDQKSESYGVLDLAKLKPEVWTRLPADAGATENNGSKDGSLTPTEVADAAYQSKDDASIISIDSACRTSGEAQETDLKKLTDLLFLGITDINYREERALAIQDTPALQTTLRGKLNGEEVMLRSVVLRRNACIYDLVYLSRPQNFMTREPDFSQFVDSLHLK